MRGYLTSQLIKLIICLVAVYFMYNFYTEVFFNEGTIIKKNYTQLLDTDINGNNHLTPNYFEFIISDGKREQHVTVDKDQYSNYKIGDHYKK